MKNLVVLPLPHFTKEEFIDKADAIGKRLGWHEKKRENNYIRFKSKANLDSSFGNWIDVKFLTPTIAMILVSSVNKFQIAEGGATTENIAKFIELFYQT